MKIVFDARPAVWFASTGIGVYTAELLRVMQNFREHQFRLIVPENCGPIIDLLRGYPAPHIVCRQKFCESQGALGMQIRALQPDIVFFPQNGFGLPEGDVGGIKVITLHDVIPFIFPEAIGVTLRETFRKELARVTAAADFIITDSYCSKNDIVKILHVHPAKIAVVHLAPSPLFRPVEPATYVSTLQKFNLADQKYVLYAGGLNTRKNVPLLMQAFFRAFFSFPGPLSLVIVGGNRAEIQSLQALVPAALRSYVTFTGSVTNLELCHLYNGALVFVYPSAYEGFGLPPLEAMACGTPVLCAESSSLPEVAGSGARYFSLHSPDGLAKLLVELVSDESLRASLQRAGIERVCKFSWEKTARETIKAFESCLKEQQRLKGRE